MRRRTVLASLSTFATVGCLGSRDATTPTEPPTNSTPTNTRTATETETATPVSAVSFASAIRYFHSNDAVGIDPPENAQFAFVSPPSGVSAVPVSISLKLGEETFTPRSSVPGFQLSMPSTESVYTDTDRSGVLVFDLPRVEADSGVLVTPQGRHSIPTASLDTFAVAPTFEIRSVSLPETVTSNGYANVSVTVENVGDARGTFLAGFYGGSAFGTMETTVAPGERGTASGGMTVYAEPDSSAYMGVVWADGNEGESIPVESEG
jgi:hypothetical protein